MATEPHSLPAKAVWASPMKKGKTGKRVLLDPDGFRLHYKDFKSGKQVNLCSSKKDLKCPVRALYDPEEDVIVNCHGNHNHDN